MAQENMGKPQALTPPHEGEGRESTMMSESSSHPPSDPEHTMAQETPIKQPISSTSAEASKRELFPKTEGDSRDIPMEDLSSSDESSQSSFSNLAELPFIQSEEVHNGFGIAPELVVQGFAVPTDEKYSTGDKNEELIPDAREGRSPNEQEERSIPRRAKEARNKGQVSKTWKRIDELEGHIRYLCSQPMDIPDEADLPYLHRGILEAKYGEVRELLDELKQLIAEVKQFTRLLSAESFKIAGDLDRERDFSKSLREIQQKLDDSAITVGMAQELMRTAHQLRNTIVVDMTPAKFRDFVLSHPVKANFLQIGMAGLPFSGKSTLLENMLELHDEETVNGNGLAIHEAIILRDNESGECQWMNSEKDDAELIAIATTLAKACIDSNQLPSFAPSYDWEECSTEEPSEIGEHFQRTYERLRNLMQGMTMEALKKLANTSLTFTNIWDVGVNKPVFEVLPILAPKIRNLLLVDVVNLERDAAPNEMYRPPDLDNENLYGTRYHARGNLLRRRTTLHYIVRCIAPTCAALLVGTFADKLDRNEREDARDRLFEAVEGMAEKMGVREAIKSDLMTVNATSTDDAKKVRAAIEDLIHRNNQYEKEIPNSWISLRCVLLDMKKLFIQKSELLKIAQRCGLRDDQELEEWLDLFQSCASIIYLSNKQFPNEYVVLDPLGFIRGLERLYYVDQQTDLPEHLSSHVEQTKYGLLSYDLVKHICKDCEDDCNLYIEVLQRLGFIAQAGNLFYLGSYHGFYFFPSLRSKHCPPSTPSDQDSLFVSFPKEVPFDIQPQFIEYFENRFGNEMTILLEECYNALRLSWSDDEGTADIRIQFSLSFAEVSVTIQPDSRSTSFRSKLYSILKTTCMDIFEKTAREVPGMQYNLAVLCPSCTTPEIKSHFIKLHPDCDENFCDTCKDCIDIHGNSKVWIHVK